MIEIKICVGTSCHAKGAYNVMTTFQQLVEKYNLHDDVRISSSYCTGDCQKGVNVKVNGELFSVSDQMAKEFFKENIMPKIKG